MMSNTAKAQANDYKIPTGPQDSISSLAINGNAQTPGNCLIATAWDNTVSHH